MKKTKIKAAFNLLKAKFLRKNVPLAVGWSITNRCNMSCSYCARPDSHTQELSTEQIFLIIDQLARLGTYMINISGGEPLLREDVGQIVRYSKNKGINTGISTNGVLVAQRLDEIKHADSVTLSLDGEEKIHDSQRSEGSYRKIIDAIRVLKASGMNIGLRTVLTRNNLSSIDFILGVAKEYDLIVQFSIVDFLPLGSHDNVRLLVPHASGLRSAISYLISQKKLGNRHIGNSFSGLTHLMQWPDYRQMPCCAGKIYCKIESDGNVYPCGNLINKVKPQSCLTQDFKSAFAGLYTKDCGSCWCDVRIEMNCIYALNPRTILNTMVNYRV